MKKIGYIIKMVTIILVFSVDNFITSHLILRYYYYKILNFLQKFCNLIYPYFAFNFTFLVFVVKLAPVFLHKLLKLLLWLILLLFIELHVKQWLRKSAELFSYSSINRYFYFEIYLKKDSIIAIFKFIIKKINYLFLFMKTKTTTTIRKCFNIFTYVNLLKFINFSINKYKYYNKSVWFNFLVSFIKAINKIFSLNDIFSFFSHCFIGIDFSFIFNFFKFFRGIISSCIYFLRWIASFFNGIIWIFNLIKNIFSNRIFQLQSSLFCCFKFWPSKPLIKEVREEIFQLPRREREEYELNNSQNQNLNQNSTDIQQPENYHSTQSQSALIESHSAPMSHRNQSELNIDQPRRNFVKSQYNPYFDEDFDPHPLHPSSLDTPSSGYLSTQSGSEVQMEFPNQNDGQSDKSLSLYSNVSNTSLPQSFNVSSTSLNMSTGKDNLKKVEKAIDAELKSMGSEDTNKDLANYLYNQRSQLFGRKGLKSDFRDRKNPNVSSNIMAKLKEEFQKAQKICLDNNSNNNDKKQAFENYENFKKKLINWEYNEKKNYNKVITNLNTNSNTLKNKVGKVVRASEKKDMQELVEAQDQLRSSYDYRQAKKILKQSISSYNAEANAIQKQELRFKNFKINKKEK